MPQAPSAAVKVGARRGGTERGPSGPEGGDAGGRVVATGTPEDVSRVKKSYTGQFLKRVLSNGHA